MTILSAVAGALARSLDNITANWADILFTSPTATGTNSNVTITFSSGGSRTLTLTYAPEVLGTISYRKNSGSYTPFTSGGTVSVATGDTLNFKFDGGGDDDGATVTVADTTDGGRTVDTFDVLMSATP